MRLYLAALALLAAAPALAVSCPAAAPFTGWERAVAVTAAADIAGADDATVRVGTPAAVRLAPAAGLRFAVPPEKPVEAGGFGGTLAFTVASPGRYRIGAGASAWLDVIEAGRPLPSVAHGHGPDCGPVRKIVDFDLKPGRHLLQLSGAKAAGVTVMVARGG